MLPSPLVFQVKKILMENSLHLNTYFLLCISNIGIIVALRIHCMFFRMQVNLFLDSEHHDSIFLNFILKKALAFLADFIERVLFFFIQVFLLVCFILIAHFRISLSSCQFLLWKGDPTGMDEPYNPCWYQLKRKNNLTKIMRFNLDKGSMVLLQAEEQSRRNKF